MSVSSALAPWVAVLVVAAGGAAAGVLFVRRVAPGILEALDVDERGTGERAAATDGTDTGASAGPAVPAPVEANAPPDPTPATVETDERPAVVTRANRLDAVATDVVPDPIDTTGTTDAVSEATRIDAVVPAAAPEPIETTAATPVVAEADRVSPVSDADRSGPSDTDGPAVVCEYCGRDDFETTAQRNGHLRWCDDYDPAGASTDGEGDVSGSDADIEHASGTSNPAAAAGTGRAEGSTVEPAVAVGTAAPERESVVERASAVEPVTTADEADPAVEGRVAAEGTTAVDAATTGRTDTTDRTGAAVNDDARDDPATRGSDPMLHLDLDEATDGATANEGPPDDVDGGFDIAATYATVRGTLERELGIDDRWTSREFYHACRLQGLDEERLDALERLTRAYESVRYGDEPALNTDELREAAARFEETDA